MTYYFSNIEKQYSYNGICAPTMRRYPNKSISRSDNGVYVSGRNNFNKKKYCNPKRNKSNSTCSPNNKRFICSNQIVSPINENKQESSNISQIVNHPNENKISIQEQSNISTGILIQSNNKSDYLNNITKNINPDVLQCLKSYPENSLMFREYYCGMVQNEYTALELYEISPELKEILMIVYDGLDLVKNNQDSIILKKIYVIYKKLELIICDNGNNKILRLYDLINQFDIQHVFRQLTNQEIQQLGGKTFSCILYEFSNNYSKLQDNLKKIRKKYKNDVPKHYKVSEHDILTFINYLKYRRQNG